jgi:DNA-binding transcriptional LysR family regulator
MTRQSIPAAQLDADDLAVFLAVAEHAGVLAAARALGRSQPAVSERVRRIEETLGAALFVRSPRGMTLTPAGAKLVGHARRMRALLAEAAQVGGREAAEPLVLAASTTPAAFVLAPLLAEFSRAHPAAGVDLRVGNTEDVLALVRAGTVPLGVVEGLGRAAGVRLEFFRDDELVPVYAPRRVEAALLRAIRAVRTAAGLAALPLLWREPGSGTRRVVEAALREAGAPARAIRFDRVLGGTLALRAAALAGLGVAFLPRCAIERELLLGELAPVGAVRGLRIARQLRWAVPPGGLHGVMAEFRRFADGAAGRRGK